jgi:hypothetical protein
MVNSILINHLEQFSFKEKMLIDLLTKQINLYEFGVLNKPQLRKLEEEIQQVFLIKHQISMYIRDKITSMERLLKLSIKINSLVFTQLPYHFPNGEFGKIHTELSTSKKSLQSSESIYKAHLRDESQKYRNNVFKKYNPVFFESWIIRSCLKLRIRNRDIDARRASLYSYLTSGSRMANIKDLSFNNSFRLLFSDVKPEDRRDVYLRNRNLELYHTFLLHFQTFFPRYEIDTHFEVYSSDGGFLDCAIKESTFSKFLLNKRMLLDFSFNLDIEK